MANKAERIILDSNLWISFLIISYLQNEKIQEIGSEIEFPCFCERAAGLGS